PEAGAVDQPRQDLGRPVWRRWRRDHRRGGGRLAPGIARWPPGALDRPGRWLPVAVDRRRPVRKPDEAPPEREGLRAAVPRPWRRPGSWRQPVRCPARLRRRPGLAARVKRICVLGATGSIGASALGVIGRHPDRFAVHSLSAGHRVDELIDLCERFQPAQAVIADERHHAALRDGLRARGLATEALAGSDALGDIAADPAADTVIAAIVGAAGLASTLAAAHAGKTLLLANKEAVVMAGSLLFAALARSGGRLLPIDSEHNAIFQCLPTDFDRDLDAAGVERLILTASGGPFLTASPAELHRVTPDQACAHPNWRMGRKISVDSATLMNKGLEV